MMRLDDFLSEVGKTVNPIVPMAQKSAVSLAKNPEIYQRLDEFLGLVNPLGFKPSQIPSIAENAYRSWTTPYELTADYFAKKRFEEQRKARQSPTEITFRAPTMKDEGVIRGQTFNEWIKENPPIMAGIYGGSKAKGFIKAMSEDKTFGNVADKMMRFEINDAKARVGNIKEMLNNGINEVTLQDVMYHPGLYKNYPELKNIPVKLEKMKDYSGMYNEKEGMIFLDISKINNKNFKNTLLHEIQHAIQEKEGFAKGGSPTAKNNYTSYKRLAGEIEARDVSARMNLTPSERGAIPPYSSENIPLAEWIIQKSGGISADIDPKIFGEFIKKQAQAYKNIGINNETLYDLIQNTDISPTLREYAKNKNYNVTVGELEDIIKNKLKINIPKKSFKNTSEAFAYGESIKNDTDVLNKVKTLIQKRNEILENVKNIPETEQNFNQIMKLMADAQFYREAAQKALNVQTEKEVLEILNRSPLDNYLNKKKNK